MDDKLFTALMSVDKGLRSQAEEYYQSVLSSNAERTLEELSHYFGNQSNQLNFRSLAGVLLRRAVEKCSDRVSPQASERLRFMFLNMWAAETNGLLLKRLAHIMAQSAATSAWNDLLPKVIEHASASQSSALIPVLNLIEIVADYCPEDILAHLAILGSFLGRFIVSSDPNTQIACARATGACIISLEDDNARAAFKPALEPIIGVLRVALSRGDEIDATNIIENLVNLAQIQPTFFKGSLDGVVGAMLAVAGTADLEFSTRAMALEFMVTMTEAAPALARKCAGIVQQLVPLTMSLMVEVDEEEAEWIREKYSEELCDESCVAAEEAIERIAAGLGGKNIADSVLGLVTQMSSSPNWKQRRAAVCGVCRLAEGSTKFFKKYVENSLVFLNGALQDPMQRVKYEGIQTIGRFAELYNDTVDVFIQRFLPQLTEILQDGTRSCERVRGHAASALINLLNPDAASAEVLSPYMHPLLSALLVCFQSASMEIQSPCLVLLGCIAQVSSDAFAPFYSSFMPGIKSILISATSTEQEMLRGKAMECAGLVGEAVGANVFAGDALEVMQIFHRAILEDAESSSSDITFEYILPACARISKALGEQFEPYLAMVMEPCLQGANKTIQFTMVDAEEDDVDGEVIVDDEAGTESTVLTFRGGGRKRVTLNTHAVQQKKQAARVLFELASSLRGYMRSYILPCIKSAVNLVTEKNSHEIRSSAALSLGKLFDAYMHAVKRGLLPPTAPAEMNTIATGIITKLLESIKGEINRTTRACSAEALKDLLLACYMSGEELPNGSRHNFVYRLTNDDALKLAQEIFQQCGNSIARRKSSEDEITNLGKGDGSFEAEDLTGESAGGAAIAEAVEEEEDVLVNLADVIGQLLKLHGKDLMPFIESAVMPALAPYVSANQPEALQIVAVSFIDDVIEFGGSGAAKYVANMLSPFMVNALNEDLELNLPQTSAYGIAKAVFRAPQVISAHLQDVLVGLLQIIRRTAPHSEGKEDEREGVTQNAVLALGGIWSFCQQPLAINAARLASSNNPSIAAHFDSCLLARLWIERLPLRSDEIGSKQSTLLLCDAIEDAELNPILFGNNFGNLSEILRIFAESFAANAAANAVKSDAAREEIIEFAHENTLVRMRTILQQLTRMANISAQLTAAFSTLKPELQNILRTVMQ